MNTKDDKLIAAMAAASESIRRVAKVLDDITCVDQKTEKENKVLFAVFSTIFGLLFSLPLYWWQGYVVRRMWEWFLSPSIATPSIYVLTGAMLIFRAFKGLHVIKGEQNYDIVVQQGLSALWFAAMLGMAALWHWAELGL